MFSFIAPCPSFSVRTLGGCTTSGNIGLVVRRRASSSMHGCRHRLSRTLSLVSGCKCGSVGDNCINSVLPLKRRRCDRSVVGRCLCTLGGTTSRGVVIGTRRTIHPANLYHACPGLVNGRSTEKARCRTFNKAVPRRIAVLPFAHLGNNPVSCAPKVFIRSVNSFASNEGGS